MRPSSNRAEDDAEHALKEIIAAGANLKLFGTRGAFDEVIVGGVNRRNEPRRVIGKLLKAEVADKAARSVKAPSKQRPAPDSE